MEDLPGLCAEIRYFIIESVTRAGGHLGGPLGVVELSIAIHFVFDAPSDTIIWDIGHQSHPHKVLTGRKEMMHTMRKRAGLSGFCSIFESKYDAFGAGHSSTAISAGLGFLVSNKMQKKDNFVIVVIGDGAMGAGMAFEAINNIPKQGRMLIVLNDNDMSICPSEGNISSVFKAMQAACSINSVAEAKEQINRGAYGLFGEMGLQYVGVVDGHDTDLLIDIMRFVRREISAPTVLHIKTQKGRGYIPAESAYNKAHAISLIPESEPSYTDVAAIALREVLLSHDKACIITPAMLEGHKLRKIKKEFADRVFDVGIAEQHAITFAAGLAASGMLPFCAIYSTFLQRGYDQVIHDVAIQKLPVRFLIERAGFIGGDGATHHGVFDISMLAAVPGFVLMAPSSAQDLVRMINTCVLIDGGPSAIRYPKGMASGAYALDCESLLVGKGRLVVMGDDNIAILSYGACLTDVMAATNVLIRDHGINPTVFDLMFAMPIDREAIVAIAGNHSKIISIEDGGFGGIGSIVAEVLDDIRYSGRFIPLRHSTAFFTSHGDIPYQKSINGIDSDQIIKLCLS